MYGLSPETRWPETDPLRTDLSTSRFGGDLALGYDSF
jgi:hypothetical protein